jgi:hypothetical protein
VKILKSLSCYVYSMTKREEILLFFHKIYCIFHTILTLNTDHYSKQHNRRHFEMDTKYTLCDFWTEISTSKFHNGHSSISNVKTLSYSIYRAHKLDNFVDMQEMNKMSI